MASGETYGRGIGEMAIADVASGQAMRRTNLTAGERAANPTLLATDGTGLDDLRRHGTRWETPGRGPV